MKLYELAALLPTARIIGDGETEIISMEMDSYKATPGTLYCCVPATPHLAFKDRHQFAGDAVARGAVALLLERDVDVDVPKLFVNDVRYAMALIAIKLYGDPSQSLNVIAITGTNGKTTTTHLIEHILSSVGQRTGLMGNLGMKIGGQTIHYDQNTMDAPDLQRSFLHMKQAGVQTCIMEASSHGLALRRILGTHIRTAVFTNLSQDHLDFHQTMWNYREAKSLLFSGMGNAFSDRPEDGRFAVLNADDEASAYFREVTVAKVISYGIEQHADVRASNVRLSAQGTTFDLSTFVGNTEISMKLIGRFNVYNALAAVTTALTEGIQLSDIRDALMTIGPIEGRMEIVNEGQPFLVLVDYAHTPDGLENALTTIRELANGNVITVFGCGGDRDRSKRPVMGKLAAMYSDFVYVTSDNPRTEQPDAILQDIEIGLIEAEVDKAQYRLIVDRRQAIQEAIAMATPGDIVLIAGKGHETYQLIGGEMLHFDDREEARAAIRGLHI